MRILIIGSGGREHALAWKLNLSPQKPEIFIAPGNGGTAEEGQNVPISDGDIPGLVAFIQEKSIDLVLVGPELPLTLGIADACKELGVLCFGPSAYAAQLEGSKVFAKELMVAAGVPTAPFEVFTDYEKAVAYVDACNRPLVVKADGLAAGKGVVVAKTAAEAKDALKSMMVDRIFGDSGARVLIEETLVGEEASFLAFCDGESVITLPSAQDHKAVFDNDTGPNTGGMGAYSPAPVLPEYDYSRVAGLTICPVLNELKKRGHPFVGILYAGLMMTQEGPMVIEYNVRFGDPECQPLLMRLEGDLLEVLLAAAQQRLNEVTLAINPQNTLCVVLTAKGYPGDYPKGMSIEGMLEAEATCPGAVKVFHAGTKVEKGHVVSSGGRVLGVTALGRSLHEAKERAYAAIGKICMHNSHYRTDIGDKGIRAYQKK